MEGRSQKNEHLKRVINDVLLIFEEMSTLLVQIEPQLSILYSLYLTTLPILL